MLFRSVSQSRYWGGNSVLIGGAYNTIASNGTYSAIVGGINNVVSGQSNVVGGNSNRINRNYVVCGGLGNSVTGEASAVFGRNNHFKSTSSPYNFIWGFNNTNHLGLSVSIGGENNSDSDSDSDSDSIVTGKQIGRASCRERVFRAV